MAAKRETPEMLLNADKEARVFYILANSEVQTCVKILDLPFYKQRSSYSSAGVYSPAAKRVMFWSDASNPDKCFNTLIQNKLIDAEYNWTIGAQPLSASAMTSTRNNVKIVAGMSRKGHAGFNRIPATGTGKLLPPGQEAVSDDAPAAPPPMRPKIEIRTPNSGLTKQDGAPKKSPEQREISTKKN